MKKLIALLLAVVLVFSFAACSSSDSDTSDEKGSNTDNDSADVKIGVILIGDENEGYTYAHIQGIKTAAANLGIADDQIIWKYNIGEDETCQETAYDLVDQGCTLVISNSYGHQSHMQQVASEVDNVMFVSMTGDTAATSGLDNFANAFTSVYQSRYVSGVVAGLKIAELVEDGKLSAENYDEDGNVKVGYVGAYPYAEVVSGYTAFYLGIKSVYEDVVMEVTYTNSWFDLMAEGEAANSLLADGCVIIGQHADSTGAPSAVQAACEEGKVCYSVGYNIDMLSVAPDVALTSATNNWAVYYEYAIGTFISGGTIATNWSAGYNDDAVAITKLGTACADGTAEKVAEVEAALKDGSLNVFDIDTFTVNGEKVESCVVDLTGDYDTDDEGDKEAIWDGYFHESELRSAPSFELRIDGITELN